MVGIAVLDQKRVAVGQHALQVAVRAERGAEFLADESEIEKGDERGDRAREAAGGGDIEMDEAAEQVSWLDEIRDEDEGQDHGRGRDDEVGQGQVREAAARGGPGDEFLGGPAAQGIVEREGGFAEDHLRAGLAAVDAAVDHAERDDAEHQKHEGEEDDGELVDPDLRAGEVEALFRQIEAHQVEEREGAEDEEEEQVDAAAAHVMGARGRGGDSGGGGDFNGS